MSAVSNMFLLQHQLFAEQNSTTLNKLWKRKCVSFELLKRHIGGTNDYKGPYTDRPASRVDQVDSSRLGPSKSGQVGL